MTMTTSPLAPSRARAHRPSKHYFVCCAASMAEQYINLLPFPCLHHPGDRGPRRGHVAVHDPSRGHPAGGRPGAPTRRGLAAHGTFSGRQTRGNALVLVRFNRTYLLRRRESLSMRETGLFPDGPRNKESRVAVSVQGSRGLYIGAVARQAGVFSALQPPPPLPMQVAAQRQPAARFAVCCGNEHSRRQFLHLQVSKGGGINHAAKPYRFRTCS
jgi:hypothetical protein